MASRNVISIDIRGLEKLQANFKRAPAITFEEISGGITTALQMVRPIMRQEAPRRQGTSRDKIQGRTPGNLRRSIQITGSGMRQMLGPNLKKAPYAFWVHEGTSPYTIRPRRAQALFWKGAPHPVKKVRHPGITPNPFVDRTFVKARPTIEDQMQRAADKIVKRLSR